MMKLIFDCAEMDSDHLASKICLTRGVDPFVRCLVLAHLASLSCFSLIGIPTDFCGFNLHLGIWPNVSLTFTGSQPMHIRVQRKFTSMCYEKYLFIEHERKNGKRTWAYADACKLILNKLRVRTLRCTVQ